MFDTDEKKSWKIMLSFEDEIIDISVIKGIKKGVMADLESPLEDNESCFYIKIYLFTYPGEIVFKFYDEEIRDKKLEELKTKLTANGVKFI